MSVFHKETKDRMQKLLEVFRQELATVRTGTASSALVEHLVIECYGSKMSLNQLATIMTPEANAIVIQPWDMNNLTLIEKGIIKSDLGLMPGNDGKVIRILIPPLSEERRNEFIRLARKMSEDARVRIRGIRRDANEKIKKMQKDKNITEDDERRGIDDIQKVTDDNIAIIDAMLKTKEEELLKV